MWHGKKFQVTIQSYLLIITGIDEMSSISVIITGIANIFPFQKIVNAIPGIDSWNSHKNTA